MRRKDFELGILMYFVFMRLVESSSLTIMCGGKDRRSRFVSKALKEGWLREIRIQARERTIHQMTVYALTKRGLKYLCENAHGTFLEDLSDKELSSISIFEKDEYSIEARKRIADTSAAVVMALAMGGTIPAEVLNRRYTFGRSNSPSNVSRYTGSKTLADYIHSKFSEDEYNELCYFGANVPKEEQICFFDSAYVKQAVAGTSDRMAARDFYKGRQIGLFQSKKQSLLTYCAPFFGMGWSKWQTKPELDAIFVWNRRYASQEVLYSREFSALLIVKDHRQFANLFNDVDHARKDGEVFGGRFDHVYLAEHSSCGVQLLRWILQNSDPEIVSSCTEIVLSQKLAKRNENPSKKEFLYRDVDGNEGMCGLHLDIKRMLFLDHWARNHPGKQFKVYCVEPQACYYRAIMPDNVSCVLL